MKTVFFGLSLPEVKPGGELAKILVECCREKAYQAVEKIPYLIVVRRGGQIYSGACIDLSNHPEGVASIPPPDLDEYARKLGEDVRRITGRDVSVVISDTEGFLSYGFLGFAGGDENHIECVVVHENFSYLLLTNG